MTTTPSIESLTESLGIICPTAPAMEHHYTNLLNAITELAALRAENETMAADLERERIRLAACGVLAQSNTPESLAMNRSMEQGYWSASADDVCRAVEREMALHAENARLVAERDGLKEKLAAEMYPMAVNPLAAKYADLFTAERSRAEAMAARVAMLENAARTALYAVEALKLPCPMDPEHPQSRRNGAYASIALNLHQTLMSTPSADLEARDARVRREALEGAWERVDAQYRPYTPATPWSFLQNAKAAILGTEAQPNGQEGK